MPAKRMFDYFIYSDANMLWHFFTTKVQVNKVDPQFRFVVVCGDGEYIIYTALAWRNKSFGTAEEFVWSADSSMYAIREGNSRVKIFKNFKEVQVSLGSFFVKNNEGFFTEKCKSVLII